MHVRLLNEITCVQIFRSFFYCNNERALAADIRYVETNEK